MLVDRIIMPKFSLSKQSVSPFSQKLWKKKGVSYWTNSGNVPMKPMLRAGMDHDGDLQAKVVPS